MFTPAARDRLRDALIAAARADPRIDGAALTGSAARDAEDAHSDVDLYFGVAPGAGRDAVLADWTAAMYGSHGALHHTDVRAGATIYRVFLLRDGLQVDLAFAPPAEFGAAGPAFRLLFGTARERPQPGEPDPGDLIGMSWLYALHARSSIARGRVWQAEYMISGMRDHVLALACVRHGVPAHQGRGMDLLPEEATAPLAGALVGSLDDAELRRAFGAATEALLREVEHVDAGLAKRLAGVLREMAH